jgi:hypothetical protein
MSKLILLLLLICSFISCQGLEDCQELQGQKQAQETAGCESKPTPLPFPEIEPDPNPADDVPHEALIFDASVQFNNFSRADEAKVLKAIEIIKKVVASREFRDRLINFTYQGQKQFVDNRGMSNGQIYRKILNGDEDLRPVIDHHMDLELELYYSRWNTVGYTYPHTLRIWMNTKFFNAYTPAEVAGNIFHEWLHKLGFDHASSHSAARDASVPYALGYLIEELGKQYE